MDKEELLAAADYCSGKTDVTATRASELLRLAARTLRERAAGAPGSDAPPCRACNGPHRYDTSVPPPLWNKVIRAGGLPDYLCTSCIVEAFVKARVSFTAELYGEPFDGDNVPVLSVEVFEIKIEDTIGNLMLEIRDLRAKLAALQTDEQVH